MNRLQIDLPGRSYPIYIGADTMQQAPWQQHIRGRRCLIVTNTTVAPLYLERLTANLSEFEYVPLILPDGESHKTPENWLSIIDALTSGTFNRDDCIIALGGGVVGDMSGFAAASFMRGIDFIQIPTTLLAQVDASVGGKTGINHRDGKNLIGAFHQPQAVVIDTNTLATLPQREFLAGMAEVIKYGILGNAELFTDICNNTQAITDRDIATLQSIIQRCCADKAAIVKADERETGQRALLNLGHTFGHAIETATQYQQYLHGEAVAIGMVMAAELAEKLGISEATAERPLATSVRNLLQELGLPVTIPAKICTQELIRHMQKDKKNAAGKIRFILPVSIGATIIRPVEDHALIASAIDACKEQDGAT